MRRPAHKKSSRSGKGGWKKLQSQGKMGKQVRLGVAVLGFLLTLIFVGKTIDFIAGLGRPFAADDPKLIRTQTWDDEEILNLVVKAEGVSLLSLNPGTNSLTIFNIPSEAYINVPFGFGNWPVRSIYGLGQGETPPIGAKLLTVGISSSLGVPVDGYLVVPDGSGLQSGDLADKVKQNPLALWEILRKSRTDLSLKEYWDFWWALKKIRSDKIESIDLGETGAVMDKTLADGSKVYALDIYKSDVILQKQLEDLKLREESLSVGIFNATEHSALAEKASRMVTNMGGRVVFTTNLDRSLQKTLVKGQNSYTTTRLTKIFTSPACMQSSKGGSLAIFQSSKQDPECSLEDMNLSPNTADVNILLGEDFYLRYNK